VRDEATSSLTVCKIISTIFRFQRRVCSRKILCVLVPPVGTSTSLTRLFIKILVVVKLCSAERIQIKAAVQLDISIV